MKTQISNIKSDLDQILKKYFDKKDIIEFSEKIVGKTTVESELRNEGLETGSFDNYNLRSFTDQVITFIKFRLKQKKMFELLFEIGQALITYGEFELAIYIHNEILKSTKDDKQQENVYAVALLAVGEIHSRQANWKESFSFVRKANRIFLEQKNYYACAKCQNLLGTIHGDLGNVVKASEHFEKSLEYLNDNPDHQLKSNIEVNLGIINTMSCNYDAAFSYFNRSLVFYQKTNNLKRLAEIKQNIGMLLLKKNDLSHALKEFDQCIEFAVASNYMQILEIAYLSKAYLYTKLKDYPYADKFADCALKICCKINDRLSIADIYKIKGIIQRHVNNYQLAESYLLTSIRLNRELANKLNEAEASYELAILYKEMRKGEESRELFAGALKYFKKIKAADEIENIKLHLN